MTTYTEQEVAQILDEEVGPLIDGLAILVGEAVNTLIKVYNAVGDSDDEKMVKEVRTIIRTDANKLRSDLETILRSD